MSLEKDLKSACESRSHLSNVIKVIEQEKASNFESGLILARQHTEGYPGWEQIDWSCFKAPARVETPVPPYFLHPGRIKDVMKNFSTEGNERPDQAQ